MRIKRNSETVLTILRKDVFNLLAKGLRNVLVETSSDEDASILGKVKSYLANIKLENFKEFVFGGK